MKKLLFFLCALLTAVSVMAQNAAPSNVTATALSHDKVQITWDAPAASMQQTRLNLFDQSQMVTHPGAGHNGYDVSATYAGQSNLGYNSNANSKFWLADDFTLTSAAQVNSIVFYAYQTGSTTTSTITGCYVRIYDTQPLDSTAVPVWTSDTVNCMSSTDFSGIYRTSATALSDSTRPIMQVVADINTTLPAGNYWVAVCMTGSLSSGPWISPVAILGQVSTGNAIQYVVADGAWGPMDDGTSYEQMGLPMIVRGSYLSDNLVGFNVYRDNTQLNSSLIEGFSYTENSLSEMTEYCYTVEAVYTVGVPAASEPVCVTTPYDNCRIMELPYVENFDSYGTGYSTYPNVAYPTCWSKYNSTTATSTITKSYPYIYATSPYSGIGSLYMYSTNTFITMAITPIIDPSININTLRVSMMLKKSSAAYEVIIGTILDPNDPDSFEPYDTLSPSTTSTWEELYVDFSNYVGDAHYIALRSDRGTTNYVYVDDFMIQYIPSCDRPSSIAISGMSSDEFTFSWVPTTQAAAWELEYRLAGEDEWTTVSDITTTSYTVTGLEPSTTYAVEVRVKALCEDGESLWREGTFSVTTTCLAVDEFPYIESFDTYGTGTSAYPTCWMKSHSTTTTSVNYPYISTTVNTAPGALYFYSSASYSVWAVTPEMNTNMSSLQADFKIRASGTGYYLVVGVIDNPYDITTMIPVDTVKVTTANTYQSRSVSFANYSGEGHYIVFFSPQATNYMYLDDLVIGEVQTCFAPASVTVASSTQSTADITWSPADDAANYELRYKLREDSVWTVISNIEDTIYTLGDLESGSLYDLQVRTLCTTSAESYWSDPVLTVQTQCQPVTEFPYTEGFENYGAGTGGTFYPTCWSRAIAYQTGTTTAPFCNTAQKHEGTASLRFQGNAAAATPQLSEDINLLQVSFWLRVENLTSSGKFAVGVTDNPNDPTAFEAVDTIHPAATATWYFYEVKFNNTTLTGENNYIVFRQIDAPSMVYFYWLDEVEVDYIPTCIRPYGTTSAVNEDGNIQLSWVDDNNAGSFSLRYRPVGAEEWIETEVYDTTFTLDEFAFNSVYEWQVKAICSSSSESYYSLEATFSTPCSEIATFPYYESFDNYGTGTGTYPTCWTKDHSQTTASVSYPYIITTNNSAPGSMSMSATSTYYIVASLPAISADYNVSDLQLSFLGRKTSAAYNLIIGVMDDPHDLSTFVPVDTVSPVNTSEWELFDVLFDNYNGTGRYITFRSGSGSAANTFYIDDVSLNIVPTCFRPTDVTVSNIGAETATVSWNGNGNESEFILLYKADTADVWEEVAGIIDTFTVLDNLAAGMDYSVKVRSNCSGEESDYSMVVTFTTLCYPNSVLPFTENFDTYASGTANFPDCWIRHTNSSTNYPYISSSYFVSPGLGMYFYNSATTYCYAALPAMDDNINIADLQVSFKMRKSSAAYALEVGVMEDPNDLSTYTVVQTVSPAETSTWEDMTVYLNSYAGTGKFITIKSVDNQENTIYIDNVVVDYAPECLLPTNVTASHITSSSATIAWGASSTESEWQIVYGPAGFDRSTVDPMTITSNPYTIEDLAPNTSYDVYLRTICNNGEISIYSNVCSFTTGCAPMQVPYTENFDSYGTGTDAYPDCWKKINSGTSLPYIYSMTYSTGLTVPGAMYFYTTATTYAYAILPEFDAEMNSLQLSLAYKSAMTDGYHLEVGVMEDPADTSSFELVQIIEPRTAVWNSFTISFTNYEGEGKYIAIRSELNATTAYIDNVVVDYAPGCVAPMNLEVNMLTLTTAEVSWRPGRDETQWIVAYGPTNFNPNVQGSIDTVYGYPHTITDLTAGTYYDFYVKALCGSDEESDWSIKQSFRTDCLLIDTLPYTESFDDYGTGTNAYPTCWYKNTTYSSTTKYPYINTTYSSEPGALYFYSTSTTYNYAVLPEFDESIIINTLRATFKLRKSSAAYSLEVGVMTDPDDVTTFVPMARVTSSTTGVFEEFEVDFSDYTGDGHFIAFASDTNTTNYIYLDDVVIDVAPSCHVPDNVTVSELTNNSAKISWSPRNDAISYDVEYGEHGFTQGSPVGTTLTVTDTFVTLVGLNPSTHYDVYVKQYCSAADESAWTNVTTFATNCDPFALPYSENFDSQTYNATTYNTAGEAPDCWATITNNTAYPAPHIVGSGSYWYHHSGSNSLIMTAGYAGNDAYAVLPEFNAPLNTLVLNFWRATESANGTLTVGYVTDMGNIAANFVPAAVITNITNANGGGVDSVDFSTLANIPTTGRIAFHWNYTSSFYSCCLDDITVDAILICDQPTNVNVSNITTQSATIAWNGGTASNWEVAYKQTTASDWNTLPAFTATLDLANLNAETNYVVKVRANCGNNVFSDWSSEAYFTTEAPTTCDVPNGLAVNNVTETTADVVWAAGDATAWNLQYKAENGNWSSSNINVTTPAYQLTNLTASTNYQVRVQADCGTGIGTSEWSNVVNFTTMDGPVQPCDAPTNLQANNITENSADISWTAGGSETSWEVQYKAQSASQWFQAIVQTPTHTIDGLNENTAYDVKVRAICSNDNMSDFVSTTFTTTETGIDNVTLSNSISLLPNPANEYIVLTVNTNVNINEVDIYNAFGQKIQTVQLNDNNARIDLSNMASGMYFVRINSNNTTATKKFIKK